MRKHARLATTSESSVKRSIAPNLLAIITIAKTYNSVLPPFPDCFNSYGTCRLVDGAYTYMSIPRKTPYTLESRTRFVSHVPCVGLKTTLDDRMFKSGN